MYLNTHSDTKDITKHQNMFHESQMLRWSTHVNTKYLEKPPVTSTFHEVHNENKITPIPEDIKLYQHIFSIIKKIVRESYKMVGTHQQLKYSYRHHY